MSVTSLAQDSAALGERLRDALAVTPSLIAAAIRQTSRRLPSQEQAGKRERVEQLVRLSAWTDAALALIELELPQWRVRRLVYDSGEWHCALSREWELPDWLDQSVEARHANLALAILRAFAEARRISMPGSRTGGPAAPQDASPLWQPICSDNFA